MGELILIKRPGLAVVAGYVKDIRYNDIILKNSGSEMKICFGASKIKKYKLSIGANIVCSVRINCFNNSEARLYAVMYSGSFDFQQYKNEKETHVFAGKIENYTKLNDGGYRIVVSWTRNKTKEYRLLYAPPGVTQITNSNMVFLTGPGKPYKNGHYYTILKTA